MSLNLKSPDYLILIVSDLDRALKFYIELLGLKLGHRAADYAQLDTGATRVALYRRSAMETTLGTSLDLPPRNAPGFEIGFKVADVDSTYSRMIAAGAESFVPPTDRFWGQRTAYVRDPDGYLIEFAQDLRVSKNT